MISFPLDYQVLSIGRVNKYDAGPATQSQLGLGQQANAAKLFQPETLYTSRWQPAEIWKVALSYSYFKGMGVELFFPDENQASLFAPWKVLTPSKLAALIPNVSYSVANIAGVPNGAWTAYLQNQASRVGVNVTFQTEPQVRVAFPVNKSFTASEIVDAISSLTSGPVTAPPIKKVALPIAPKDLMATGQIGLVALSWSSTAGADYYEVLRGSSSGKEVVLGTAETNEYVDKSVKTRVIYYYQVLAVNKAGASDLSNEATATPLGPPSAPDDLMATSTVSQINLAWTPILDADSYSILRGSASGGEKTYAASVGSTFIDTAIIDGVPYFYQVQAINQYGSSGRSNEASSSGSLPAPANLVATAKTEEVVLAWDAVVGATSYIVFRGIVSNGEVSYKTSSLTSYTDVGATGGTTYFYTVKAVNAYGASLASNEVSATPLGILGPTNLQATGGVAEITLTWTAAPVTSETITYNLRRGTAPGGETAYANVATTSYQDTKVVAGTTYYYVVEAGTPFGASLPSNEVTAALVSAKPNAPIVTATGRTADILVQWSVPVGAAVASYNVLRSTVSGGEVAYVKTSATQFVDTYTVFGTTYYYKVQSVNGFGTSGKSNEASAMWVEAIPNRPQNLAATGKSDIAVVNLTWQAPAGDPVSYYEISRSVGAPGNWTVIATGIKTLSFTNGISVDFYTQYFYEVVAVQLLAATKNSLPSNEASITLTETVPPTPTGFFATSLVGAVALHWKETPRAKYYNLYRYGGSPPSYVLIRANIEAQAGEGLAIDSGLAYGTKYAYKLQAGNGSGTSALSNFAEATAGSPLPGPIAGLTAKYPAFGYVQILWDAAQYADSYTLSYGGVITEYPGTQTSSAVMHQPTRVITGGIVQRVPQATVIYAVNEVGKGPSSTGSF